LTQAICQAAIDKYAWMLNVSDPGLLLRYSDPNRAAGTLSAGTLS